MAYFRIKFILISMSSLTTNNTINVNHLCLFFFPSFITSQIVMKFCTHIVKATEKYIDFILQIMNYPFLYILNIFNCYRNESLSMDEFQ